MRRRIELSASAAAASGELYMSCLEDCMHELICYLCTYLYIYQHVKLLTVRRLLGCCELNNSSSKNVSITAQHPINRRKLILCNYYYSNCAQVRFVIIF